MSERFGIRERLVQHVQTLERRAEAKKAASDLVNAAFDDAKRDGFDPATLKVVLKLRKLTPRQREDRRALEGIYMANLGMLEGEALPEASRRRLDDRKPSEESAGERPAAPEDETEPAVPPVEQPSFALKDPEEARAEGSAAAAEGKRIYDNPYPAGDPCRAAWDEGWCAANKSNGMEPPPAYQRRTKAPESPDDAEKKGAA